MPFQLQHTAFAKFIEPTLRESPGEAFFEVNEESRFQVLFPGKLARRASASFFHRFPVERPPVETGAGQPGGGTEPLHAGFDSQLKSIPLTLRLFTPDGVEFTADEVTLADLRKFRDDRGTPLKWSLRLNGRSETLLVDEGTSFNDVKGVVRVGITETVASESATPLLSNVALAVGTRTFQCDLYRLGTFIAEIKQAPLSERWVGSMRLLDPSGAVAAQTTGSKLSFVVSLPTLAKSRNAANQKLFWTLEVLTQSVSSGGFLSKPPRLGATVMGAMRFEIAPLKERIDALLGKRGSFIKIFGEDTDTEARLQLKITDAVAAETMDMHGLLEGALLRVNDGFGVATDIEADKVYTLGARRSDVSRTISVGVGEVRIPMKLNVGSLKVKAIDVDIGPGVKLGVTVPAIRLTIAVSGKATITSGSLTIADIKVPGGVIEIEVGMKVAPDGTPQIVSSVPDEFFDGDINAAAAAALIATGGLGILTAAAIETSVDNTVAEDFNDPLVKGLRETLENPTLAPSILMMLAGAHLTYTSMRVDPDAFAFAFDHVAPLEPDLRPSEGYHGAIGRNFTQLGPNAVRFNPILLPDTWKADNLAKIDHIVFVMMENRSYDHVLGYRAQIDDSNGLTQELIDAIQSVPRDRVPYVVRKLRDAGFPKNAAEKMTQLPRSVGHLLSDVEEQLRFRVPGPGGKTINSPRGFVDNFLPRINVPSRGSEGVVQNDVLGFYDNEDLPFFEYLATNYAYSDRYYCSHPGPTFPNRMYSLTGDVQHDRYGFPILDNNNGDNFLLSRTSTIFDLLARRNVGFRVYESQPSVAMLRMFARYATDTTNIVSIGRLAQDVANGDLPPFTMIEPAFHHHPPNDDHPPADMHLGQIFLQNVYETLRFKSKPGLWEKTLLVITYDEHGGLYDHAVPPVADLVQSGGGLVLNPGGGTSSGPATPRTLMPIHYGVRVPTFVVSPWSVRGKGPSILLDHCSILKTVLARFFNAEKPFLSDRVSASHSLNGFLTEQTPRMNTPRLAALPFPPALTLPGPNDPRAPGARTKIITKPLLRREMREGSVDYEQICGRWARQLGR